MLKKLGYQLLFKRKVDKAINNKIIKAILFLVGMILFWFCIWFFASLFCDSTEIKTIISCLSMIFFVVSSIGMYKLILGGIKTKESIFSLFFVTPIINKITTNKGTKYMAKIFINFKNIYFNKKGITLIILESVNLVVYNLMSSHLCNIGIYIGPVKAILNL